MQNNSITINYNNEEIIQNKMSEAQEFLNQGLISSAYEAMGHMYIRENETLKNFFNSNNIFKLLSTREKEEITGIYFSFGNWEWEHQVGGSFSFNKRKVNYSSSNLSLQFSDHSDQVLIGGHIASKKHPNWNNNPTIAVNWFDYKIIDNKKYIKAEEAEYDAMFEIISLTDTKLELKLLINTTDVNVGQIYSFDYKRT